MAKRDLWTIGRPAAEIATAALEMQVHHQDRLTYWKSRREQAEKDLREKGIQVDEAISAGTSNYAAGPRYDQGLLRAHQDCALKVEEHRTKARQYAAWHRLLQLAAERQETFPLDADDCEFFRL